MWRLAKWLMVMVMAAGVPLAGQAVISGQVNYNGNAVPYAQIQVCAVTSSGTPCEPVSNLYSDYNLTHSIANPNSADQFGNYTFFAPYLSSPAFYDVQVVPVAGITWSYVVGAGSPSGTEGCSTIGVAGTINASNGDGGCQYTPSDYGATTASTFTFGSVASVTALAASCNGSVCTVTASNGFSAGQVVTFPASGFAPACMESASGPVQSAGLSSTQFEIEESATSCSGVVAPSTGGTVIYLQPVNFTVNAGLDNIILNGTNLSAVETGSQSIQAGTTQTFQAGTSESFTAGTTQSFTAAGAFSVSAASIGTATTGGVEVDDNSSPGLQLLENTAATGTVEVQNGSGGQSFDTTGGFSWEDNSSVGWSMDSASGPGNFSANTMNLATTSPSGLKGNGSQICTFATGCASSTPIVFKVNGTSTGISQTVQNLNGTTPASPTGFGNVTWQADTSGDDTAYYQYANFGNFITPPASGNYVVLYPTTSAIDTDGAAYNLSCSFSTAASSGSITRFGSASADSGYADFCGIQWGGFTLPSSIPASSVTAIQAVMVYTREPSSSNTSLTFSCTGTASLTPGFTPTNTTVNLPVLTSPTSYNFSAATCLVTDGNSSNVSAAVAYQQVAIGQIALLVYSPDAPAQPTPSSITNILAPLNYNAYSNSIGLTWPYNNGGTSTGSSNAYAVNVPAYTNTVPLTGTTITFTPNFTSLSTPACTLALNGATASPLILAGGGACQAGSLSITACASGPCIAQVTFDGSNWELNNPVGGSGGGTTYAATFNNSGSGAASGTTFNGSAAQTISYNTLGAQQALTLTTIGTSGAATLSGGTLNIPQYSGGSGSVTSFAAPSGSWPSWLVPTVTNSTTTPSLAVAASAIPNASLATQTANTVLGALTATTPSGLAVPSCSGTSNALTWTSGTGFGCNTISGTGSVTSFSAGNLSPLFTTSVATATSTPALTFSASTFAAHTFYGNNTGSTTTPSASLIGASDVGPNAYAVSSGPANAQVLTLTPAITSINPTVATNLTFSFLPGSNNTGSGFTLTVNGLGPVPVVSTYGQAPLVANDIVTNAIATVKLDAAGNLELQNPQTHGAAVCGAGNIPCTNTSNTFSAGTQTVSSGNTNTVPAVIKGSGGYINSAYVQSGSNNAGNNPSITLSSSVTTGNTLIAILVSSMTGYPISVTDSKGNTFTSLYNDTFGTNAKVAVYAAPITTGGSDTVTCNISGVGDTVACNVYEISGLQSTTLDGSVSLVTGGVQSTITTGTLTPSQPDLLFTALGAAGPGNVAASGVGAGATGYTNRVDAQFPTGTGANNVALQTAIAFQSSGTYSATWDSSTITSIPSGGASFALLLAIKSTSASSQTSNLFQFQSSSNTTMAGNLGNGDPFIVPQTYATVNGAEPCSSTTAGTLSAITDSTVSIPGQLVTVGGGSYGVGIYCNGTNWVVSSAAWTGALGTNQGGTGVATTTAQVAGNITASTGWGTSGAAGNGISAVSGLRRFQFTITAAGTPTANPTFTATLPATFATAPLCHATQVGGTGTVADISSGTATTTSTGTMTYQGTPVAASTYTIQVDCSI